MWCPSETTVYCGFLRNWEIWRNSMSWMCPETSKDNTWGILFMWSWYFSRVPCKCYWVNWDKFLRCNAWLVNLWLSSHEDKSQEIYITRFVVFVIFCQGECFLFFVIFGWGDCWPIFVIFRQTGVPANHHHQPPPEGPLAVREPGQAHAKISDRFWREDGPARADVLPAAPAGIPHRKHGWVAGTRSSPGVHETFEKDKNR